MATINWYPGHMAKSRRMLIEQMRAVDAVIELCDARAPYATRNPDLDALCRGKQRILILNKADLAEERRTRQWMDYFRDQGLDAVKFNANGGKAKEVLAPIQRATQAEVERMKARGVNKTVRLMVIGIPNVGKSTFINSFAGAARAKAANKPGVTRGKQWITVDDYDLMDMPGVLWKKFDSLETATNLAFIGSIKDDILDIEELACGLLSGVRAIYPQRLMERYKLDEQALALPPYDLLQAIGAKRGMLISGGEVDTERAAKMLVGEFRASKWGRISLERPPQRAEVTDWEGDDADEDEQ